MREFQPTSITGALGGCFIAGTLISTPIGDRSIESLKKGDIVTCFDHKGNLHESAIAETFVHHDYVAHKLVFWGGQLIGTSNHYLLNERGAFTELGHFKLDEPVINKDGDRLPVESLEVYPARHTVYNFRVEKYHTYIANGIRVHNGGGGKQGGEQADTIRSTSFAQVLDLLSEGEIEGVVGGLKGVYLDNTPVQNPDNSYNFNGVSYDFRVGTQAQPYLQGIAEGAETPTAVGVPVRKVAGATVRNVTNTGGAINAVRIKLEFPALQEYQSDGGVTGSSVRYQISIQPFGGSYVLVIDDTLSQKISTPYQRDYYISLDTAASWNIKIERITNDSTSQRIQNLFNWVSYSTVIEAKFRYPNSALVGLSIDAKYFRTVPTRGYKVRGIKIRIPINATVQSTGRLTFSGVWNGTFKTEWCNDPAWILYDLLTSTRYGAGIAASQIDKYEFYVISQYCNELVDNGFAGTEARFSCNCYIQNQEDAFNVITTLASVFRGICYWADGTITPSQDAPSTAIRQFTTSDVTKFNYSGTSARTRYTVAIVTWNDPTDFYRQKPEVVEDPDGILLYGYRETKVIAFGCTTRGQANRLGKAILLSNRLETQTVSFEIASQGIPLRPREVIEISDTKKNLGIRNQGRVVSATTTSVTLDSPVTIAGTNYLQITLSTGVTQKRTISNGAGTYSTLTVTVAYSEIPSKQSTWVLFTPTAVPQYRILGITEKEPNKHEVTAVTYSSAKYALIEDDLFLEAPQPPIRIPQPTNAPTNVAVSLISSVVGATNNYTARVTWTAPINSASAIDPFTQSYEIQLRRSANSNWGDSATATFTNYDYISLPFDTYYARVRAIDVAGGQSRWVESVATVNDGVNISYDFTDPEHSVGFIFL